MESLNLATRDGLRKYLQNLELTELQKISQEFQVVFNELPGNTKEEKSSELLAYVDRRKKIPELTISAINSYITKQLDSEEYVVSTLSQANVLKENLLEALGLQINSLNEQVQELRRNPVQNSSLKNQLDELAKTADTAHKLTANVLLPSQESLSVRLAPIYQIDRLQEYQSDENWAFLAVGTFAGTVMGIITNWANNEGFEWTKVSIFLLILFSVLTILAVLWAIQLSMRTKNFINEINSNIKPEQITPHTKR